MGTIMAALMLLSLFCLQLANNVGMMGAATLKLASKIPGLYLLKITDTKNNTSLLKFILE